jgi:hypothetical protein
MAAAREPEDADPGRAELYLRLQVEAELRRGLAMPRYEPPRQRLFPDRIPGALLTLQRRRRAAAMRRRLRQARSASQAPVQSGRIRRIVTASADRVRASAVGRLAAPALGRLLERPVAGLAARRFTSRHWIRLHMWRLTSRWRRRRRRVTEMTPVDLSLERVSGLAGALTTIGAISAATQTQVLEDFGTALAVRGMTDPHTMLGRMPWRPWGRPVQPYTSGPLRVIPFGVVTDFELEGRQGRIYFGTLVTDAGSATLNFRARLHKPAEESPVTLAQLRAAASARSHQPVMSALDTIEATDSLGGTYGANFSGGGSDEEWEGRFHLHPVPPAAARWLDISVPGTAAPVRVSLDAPPPALPVSSRPLDPRDAADRYLDVCTVEQLQQARPGDEEYGDWPGLFRLAADLRGASVLTARSPSLGRMAAAADKFGVRRPDPLADIKPLVLPAEWLGQLARADASDGPAGHITIATALPVVDGAQCVVADLESEPASTLLHVHARGWPDSHRYGVGHGELFHWTARDDVGGWYTMSESSGSYSDGEADMDMELHPALDPRAQELQIILTGRTAEVSVTVPLNWQPNLLREGPLNEEME